MLKNKYDILGDVTHIYVTTKGSTLTVIVDTDVLEELQKIDKSITCIYSGSKRYIGYRTGGPNRVWVNLHRLISKCPEDKVVDHEDGDTLNNRRYNLKVCTQYENTCNRADNTSGVPGVSWYSSKGKWHAKTWVGKKQVHIGYYDCKYKAGRAIAKYRIQHNMVVVRKSIRVENFESVVSFNEEGVI